MAPSEHLDWFEENVRWFEQLQASDLATPVPSCPGWSVQTVINHLSVGLGLGYSVALSKGLHTSATEAFDGVDWPDIDPVGLAALESFSNNLDHSISTFLATAPETPCWTYAGPGVAKFWFRRAAIETALHRLDVEEAIATEGQGTLPADRADDAIAETLEFALPFAANLIGWPEGRLRVEGRDGRIAAQLGSGDRQTVVSGESLPTLLALWGRGSAAVEVSGDQALADEWLTTIERAFAGR